VDALPNSPLTLPVSDKSFANPIFAPAVTSARSLDGEAPLTTNEAPGMVWNVGRVTRPALESCAQATRANSVDWVFMSRMIR